MQPRLHLLLRRRRQLRRPGREHAGGDRAGLGRPAALPGGGGERVNLAFLGGEPLLNRGVLRAATERAYVLAAERGIDVTFSITTNGTRLTVDDGDFFEAYGFAVTVSVDGIGPVHDRLRPFLGGQGASIALIAQVAPLLERQRRMQVSARVTVTPSNLRLAETLEQLVGLGFHSVGFSPLLRSPTGRDELGRAELATMLEEMVACGAGVRAPGDRR